MNCYKINCSIVGEAFIIADDWEDAVNKFGGWWAAQNNMCFVGYVNIIVACNKIKYTFANLRDNTDTVVFSATINPVSLLIL